ncbi:MAG: amino acid ABC transporter substrate-binding protein [Ruminococcus sp.]|nr:amino acid ABC transporter substrate-binding protein [Ruminococcus sp.]
MKRTIALLLAVLMLATLALAGCGSTNDTASGSDDNKTAATVSEDGSTTFTVGFDAEFPPYGYKDKKTGEYTGFDLELAEEVCNRLGWTLEKRPIDWDSKDMELDSGTISCIWNGFTMNGREDDYTWSVPYIDNTQVVVVKKGSDIKSLDDLAGKVVAVQADSSALAALTGDDVTDANKKLAASFKDLQQIGDYNSALMNLDAGAVDAVCMDIGVANYNVDNNKDKYELLDEEISTEQYAIGFKKGNTALKDIVEKTLLEMYEDGTVEKIANKKEYNLAKTICLGND